MIDVSDDAIRVSVCKSVEQIPLARVVRVDKTDSLKNGAVSGLVAGVGFGLIVSLSGSDFDGGWVATRGSETCHPRFRRTTGSSALSRTLRNSCARRAVGTAFSISTWSLTSICSTPLGTVVARVSGANGRSPWWEASAGPSLDAAGRVVAFSSLHPIDSSDTRHDFDLFVEELPFIRKSTESIRPVRRR